MPTWPLKEPELVSIEEIVARLITHLACKAIQFTKSLATNPEYPRVTPNYHFTMHVCIQPLEVQGVITHHSKGEINDKNPSKTEQDPQSPKSTSEKQANLGNQFRTLYHPAPQCSVQDKATANKVSQTDTKQKKGIEIIEPGGRLDWDGACRQHSQLLATQAAASSSQWSPRRHCESRHLSPLWNRMQSSPTASWTISTTIPRKCLIVSLSLSIDPLWWKSLTDSGLRGTGRPIKTRLLGRRTWITLVTATVPNLCSRIPIVLS